jgi:hypothetical protein
LKDAVIKSVCIASNDLIILNNELKKIHRGIAVAEFKVISANLLWRGFGSPAITLGLQGEMTKEPYEYCHVFW